MHFILSSLLFSWSLGAASAHPEFYKRADTSIARLYAYGGNLTSLPLFYGDGQAFLGWRAPSNASIATNVSFEISDTTFVATPTNDTSNVTVSTTQLYIDTTNGAFNAVGFTVSDTSNTSATTSGFLVFGSLLMWQTDAGSLEAKWYAEPTDTDNVYVLKWNVENTATDSAFPVVVKTHD